MSGGPRRAIAVLNCGSSSVKADVFVVDVDGAGADIVGDNVVSAHADRVGTPQCTLTVETAEAGGAKDTRAMAGADHGAVVAALVADFARRGFDVKAVGHRVVHGGVAFRDSVVIDDAVVQAIEGCVPLAPLHNPANLKGIAAARTGLPVPQVAVFDTAFHSTLPKDAYLYALPRALHNDEHVRRYGFHGTSHRYVAERAAAFFARPLSTLKLVTAHLGNGCSACAIDGGKSVDTTMGMTPLEGLVMGTRSGDVDPAVVLHLAKTRGIDAADKLLNKESGLLGVSGFTHDMRDLVAAAADAAHPHHDDAALAIAVFARRAKKAIGALACSLGGLDGIVFTGGIGERSPKVRAAICDGLRVIGALLHEQKNASSSTAERDLSTMDSRVRILVIPTDEERAIATDALRLLGR